MGIFLQVISYLHVFTFKIFVCISHVSYGNYMPCLET
jgi:hypothetical protein